MSVAEKEIKIIKLSGKRYDLIQKCKKANPDEKRFLEFKIEEINKKIEELLNAK